MIFLQQALYKDMVKIKTILKVKEIETDFLEKVSPTSY